ncbi:MAG: hypothetical protein FWG10_05745 [Eubacteriaceae bacterium]|nr:hypothetical protein [Eubacteriaceae bacterium]
MDKNINMSVISLYVSLFFLVISRFIYNIEDPAIVKGQDGDFFLWMSRLPFAIILAITIPLIVSIVYLRLYVVQTKERSS